MTLDDFLKSCKEKGHIPLSYRNKTKYVDGSEYSEEFKSSAFRDSAAGLHDRGRRKGSEKARRIDDVVSRLYGSEVVIRTPQGFHYGELDGYDGRFFYLKSYCFSRNPMDTFEYGAESVCSEDAVVPADGVISVGEIPMVVDEEEETTGGSREHEVRF